MRYLIAIDSDGTLRHSNGEISNRTKEIVKKIIINNVVVVCTARPRYHTLKISKELGTSDYLISSNGTEVFDNKKGTIVWAAYLEDSDCKKIFDYAFLKEIRVLFVLENTEYVTQFVRNDDQILLDENNLNEVLCGKVKQIMVIGKNKEEIKNFKNIVVDEYKLCVMDSSNDDKEETWFSVVSNNSSKGIALLKLAEYLNIPDDKTIAIGNDRNDIPMFDEAYISVSVENATEDVKKHANMLTTSNDKDGVAVFLEEFYEKNKNDFQKNIIKKHL